jgi:hypothetical protein
VTPNFFTLLGHIAFGRNFAESDAAPPPPPPRPDNHFPIRRDCHHNTILSHVLAPSALTFVIGKTCRSSDVDDRRRRRSSVTMVFIPVWRNRRRTRCLPGNRIDYGTASRSTRVSRCRTTQDRRDASTGSAQLADLTADLRSRFPIKKTSNTVWYAEPMSEGIVKNGRRSSRSWAQ